MQASKRPVKFKPGDIVETVWSRKPGARAEIGVVVEPSQDVGVCVNWIVQSDPHCFFKRGYGDMHFSPDCLIKIGEIDP